MIATLLTATLAAAPAPQAERLVTLGAVVTEIVHALGADDAIVGVDTTSAAVPLGREVPEVGFFRRVSPPGVLALRPTHVLATDEVGPPQVFEALAAAEVRVTRVPSEPSVEAAIQRIVAIADAVEREAEGRALVAKLRGDLEAIDRPATPPRVLFVYARGGGTLLVAGQDTSASAMIELAGGVSAVTAFDGFAPFSAEAVLGAAPDVLLFTEGGLASMGGREGVAAHPVLGATPAAAAGRVVAMDDLRLLGFGPELGAAATELAQRLGGPR
jgi:iron complex transport system substrate-binding protein